MEALTVGAWEFHQTTARILRPVDAGDGVIDAPVEHIAALPITHLWPLSAGTIAEGVIESPQEAKECYHAEKGGGTLPDVAEGDTLEVSGVGYPVSHVSEWTDQAVPTLRIIVGEVKF